ncbi:MAG: hypothetical protein JW894_02030 [Bacteroidales bacterium]|nr:hypothetical protein [Bacteroidales bacterium]
MINHNYYLGSVKERLLSLCQTAEIAICFNVKSHNLEKEENPLKVFKNALMMNEPVFINVPIHYSENVFPLVTPGSANKTMIGYT